MSKASRVNVSKSFFDCKSERKSIIYPHLRFYTFVNRLLLLCLDFDGTSAYFVLPFHFSDSDTKTSSSSHLALISYSDVFQAILNCLQYVSTLFLFS